MSCDKSGSIDKILIPLPSSCCLSSSLCSYHLSYASLLHACSCVGIQSPEKTPQRNYCNDNYRWSDRLHNQSNYIISLNKVKQNYPLIYKIWKYEQVRSCSLIRFRPNPNSLPLVLSLVPSNGATRRSGWNLSKVTISNVPLPWIRTQFSQHLGNFHAPLRLKSVSENMACGGPSGGLDKCLIMWWMNKMSTIQ